MKRRWDGGERYAFQEKAEEVRVRDLIDGIHDDAVGDILGDIFNITLFMCAAYSLMLAGLSLSECPAWACAPPGTASLSHDSLEMHHWLVRVPAAPLEWAVCGSDAADVVIVCSASLILPAAAAFVSLVRLWRSVACFPVRYEKKMM